MSRIRSNVALGIPEVLPLFFFSKVSPERVAPIIYTSSTSFMNSSRSCFRREVTPGREAPPDNFPKVPPVIVSKFLREFFLKLLRETLQNILLEFSREFLQEIFRGFS